MAMYLKRDIESNDSDVLLIVGWVLLAVTTVVLILRFYTRVTRIKRIAIDDYLMVASVVTEYLHMAFITVGTQHGLGRHFSDLEPVQQQAALKWTIGFIELFAVAPCALGRISFCAFLLFLIAPNDRKRKYALWGVIATQIIINLIVVVQIYTQCGSKITALWDYEVAATTTCQSPMVETVLGYVQSSTNSMCDVVLTVLPMTILWSLQMPLNQKIGLGLVLTLSVFALGASIAKCVAIGNLGKGDLTWYMVQLQIWVVVENNTVSLAASIPTLRPLLRKKGTASSSTPAYHLDDTRTKRTSRSKFGGNSRLDASIQNDGDSEEYILSNSTGIPDQITKTTDVVVTSEERNGARIPGMAGHGNMDYWSDMPKVDR